jgi:hypothetical protein
MGSRIALALGAAVGVVLLGMALSRRLFDDPAPKPAPAAPVAPAAPPAAKKVVVLSVSGVVARSRAGGADVPLAKGDVLAADETIHTGESGSAALQVGSTAEVQVADRTEFSISEMTDELSRVQLKDGRLSAVVHGDKSRLRVETSGNEAAAETEAGAFSLLATRGGQVTLATSSGRVRLSARDQSVEVAAGFQSTVRKDGAPTAPTAIPSSLFLKLARPRALVQRERQTVVTGRTAAGAVVSINGVRVGVDEHGEISTTVALRDGPNAVRVSSEDVTGRRQSQNLPTITVESRSPNIETKVKW